MASLLNCDNLLCYMSLTREQRQKVLFEKLCAIEGVLCDKTPVIVEIAADDDTGSIPAGAYNYTVVVTGDNGTIGGTAVVDGTRYPGGGPLAAAIPLVTGATTTMLVTYETCVAE